LDELGERVMMFMTWMEIFLNSPEHVHQVDMKKWLHLQVAVEAKWDTTENHMSCRRLNQDRVELFIKNPAFPQQQFSAAFEWLARMVINWRNTKMKDLNML
jgi:hypothetical protein